VSATPLPAGRFRVTRSRRPPTATAVLSAVVVLALVSAPYVVYADITGVLVNLFILLVLATTWNLLAGYAGLISVGQQAYVGMGAYTVLVLAQNGVSPYLAIPAAAVVCAVAALPISLLVFRLRNEYFAIGTWVVAEALLLIAVRFPSLGGGTGASLPGMSGIDPALRQAFTYWAALAVVVATLAGAYLLLRSRVGLDLTAIRDDEVGAASVGVRVSRAKRIVYLAAAAGAGAAGALLAVSQLNVLAGNVFSVQWSAYMIFVAVIGGVGTIEGPILGTVIFFTLQHTLAQNGAWYLILVGGIAVVVAMFAPRGLWGLLADRFDFRLFPVGYYLHDEVGKGPP
jgi:branched-chain amino acid transport system permease protein